MNNIVFSDTTSVIDLIINNKINVIGFIGNIGSGKNYISNKISDELLSTYGKNITHISFASPLKALIYETYGLIKNKSITKYTPNKKPMLDFFKKYLSEKIKNNNIKKEAIEVYEYFNKFILDNIDNNTLSRIMLIKAGEYFRNKYDENIWVNILLNNISKGLDIYDDITFVITDIRYVNEVLKIKKEFKDKSLIIYMDTDLEQRIKFSGYSKEEYIKLSKSSSELSVLDIYNNKLYDIIYKNKIE